MAFGDESNEKGTGGMQAYREPMAESDLLLTIEEAACCIVHYHTRTPIRPGTLRAWIAQAQVPTSRHQFEDERAIHKAGAAHALRVAQIQALLVGRPYTFVTPRRPESAADEEQLLVDLERHLDELRRTYHHLSDMLQVLQDSETMLS